MKKTTKKNNIKLTKEEQELETSFEADNWEYAGDDERKKLIGAAKNSRLTIRISKELVLKIKELSADEGIPYQTYITSIMHKYVTGQLIDKKSLKTVIKAMKKAS